MAVCKAILETNIFPDFIVVDGAEGGTGAAPPEFSDHLGAPLLVGLNFVNNTLKGAGLRDKIKIGASGKIVSTFDIVTAMALGADWCNSARGFMFALGCIQSQSCHTNRCPVGVATQDASRQKALVVSDKSKRVYNFHRNTMQTLTEFVAAIGLNHPAEIRRENFHMVSQISSTGEPLPIFPHLEVGELLLGSNYPEYRAEWDKATADSFDPINLPAH
jgi:glutamate synthase domain-containing protein 2